MNVGDKRKQESCTPQTALAHCLPSAGFSECAAVHGAKGEVKLPKRRICKTPMGQMPNIAYTPPPAVIYIIYMLLLTGATSALLTSAINF